MTDTGDRREIGRTFDTEREAKKWGHGQETVYRDPNRKPPSEENFAHLFERWLTGAAAGRTRDTTVKAYRRYGQPLIRALGTKPLKALIPTDFQTVYAQMLREGKSTSTVYHAHVVAHRSLDEAVNWGLYSV